MTTSTVSIGAPRAVKRATAEHPQRSFLFGGNQQPATNNSPKAPAKAGGRIRSRALRRWSGLGRSAQCIVQNAECRVGEGTEGQRDKGTKRDCTQSSVLSPQSSVLRRGGKEKPGARSQEPEWVGRTGWGVGREMRFAGDRRLQIAKCKVQKSELKPHLSPQH